MPPSESSNKTVIVIVVLLLLSLPCLLAVCGGVLWLLGRI